MSSLSAFFPNVFAGTYGIFKELESFEVPWQETGIDGALDIDYFYTYAGDRSISPGIEKMYQRSLIETPTATDDELKTTVLLTTAYLLFNRFGDKWRRLWECLVVADYEPLDNLRRTDIMTANAVGTTTRKEFIDQSETDIIDETNTVANTKFAFNSTSAVSTDGATQNNKTNGAGNVHTTKTNAVDGNKTVVTTEQTPYQLESHGSIGVITNQVMLTQEMILRDKYNYFTVVFDDINTFMTISVYDIAE